MSLREDRRTESYLAIAADKAGTGVDREDAARNLQLRLTPRIRGILASRGLPADVVEDGIGDLFLKLFDPEAMHFDASAGASLRDYVAKCAYNWAATQHRNKVAHRGADAPHGGNDNPLIDEADEFCKEFASVLSDVVDNEQRSLLRDADERACQGMKEEYRPIVRLLLENKKPKDIGAELGIRPSTVHRVKFDFLKLRNRIFVQKLGGSITWLPRK